MPLPKGTMTVDVLDDGTVRSQTGDMGGVNHRNADDFMLELARLMGGAVEEAKLAHSHQHEHSHDHTGTHHHQ